MQSDKLRILHLTFEPLSHSSGGGLGVYQTGSSILDGNIADVGRLRQSRLIVRVLAHHGPA